MSLTANDAKVKDEEKFDGYYVIESNNSVLIVNQV